MFYWTCPAPCGTPHKLNFEWQTKDYKCAWCGAPWGATVWPTPAPEASPVPQTPLAKDIAQLEADAAATASAAAAPSSIASTPDAPAATTVQN